MFSGKRFHLSSTENVIQYPLLDYSLIELQVRERSRSVSIQKESAMNWEIKFLIEITQKSQHFPNIIQRFVDVTPAGLTEVVSSVGTFWEKQIFAALLFYSSSGIQTSFIFQTHFRSLTDSLLSTTLKCKRANQSIAFASSDRCLTTTQLCSTETYAVFSDFGHFQVGSVDFELVVVKHWVWGPLELTHVIQRG